MVLRFFLFAVAFLFASCTELGERDNPDDPHGINFRNSSSSVEPSSSSAVVPLSSVAEPSSSSIASPPSSSSSKPSSSSVTPAVSSSSSAVVPLSSVAEPSSSSVASPPSSSSSKPSSSSVTPAVSSSSSVSTQSGVIPGPDVSYEGETYQTVVIGKQTWFKRNLNYAVAGSKCGGDYGKLKDENTSNCNTYGRLFNWATAMALPASCNESSCSGQINAKHKGICPAGWHIPSDDDWNVLMKYVNPDCSDNSTCADAGTKLKATSGCYEDEPDNYGTDNYGFSALPSGFGVGDNFYVCRDGYWWSTSEYNRYDAYSRYMYYDDEHVGANGNKYVDWIKSVKYNLHSVRCVKD